MDAAATVLTHSPHEVPMPANGPPLPSRPPIVADVREWLDAYRTIAFSRASKVLDGVATDPQGRPVCSFPRPAGPDAIAVIQRSGDGRWRRVILTGTKFGRWPTFRYSVKARIFPWAARREDLESPDYCAGGAS